MKNQEIAITELRSYADARFHSVLIYGPNGSGKTHLAKQYAEMLGIRSFVELEPNVNTVRQAIADLYMSDAPTVICIENLDCGVKDVSNALLKFVEEPPDNVYIVITCRDVRKIPDTIHSRCKRIGIERMDMQDILMYAESKDKMRLQTIKGIPYMYEAIESTRDIDYLYGMEFAKLQELSTLPQQFGSKESASRISWKVQRFGDGTKVYLSFLIRMVLRYTNVSAVKLRCIRCLQDIDAKLMPEHIILMKFIMDLKYS